MRNNINLFIFFHFIALNLIFIRDNFYNILKILYIMILRGGHGGGGVRLKFNSFK